MDHGAESVAEYSDEYKHKALLSGAPLHFPCHAPIEGRKVLPEWIREAVRNGVPVNVDNAVLLGPLDLMAEECSRPFVITNSRVGELNLTYTTFAQVVRLDGTVIDGAAKFDGARFGRDLWLRGIHVEGEASFRRVHVEGTADLHKAVFKQATVFDSMHVGGDLFCSWSTFKGEVSALGLSVEGRVCFVKTTFRQAIFNGMVVGGAVKCIRTTFAGETQFIGARIGWQAQWIHVIFKKGAVFDGVSIAGDLICFRSTFCGAASFIGLAIAGQAQWTRTVFEQDVAFDETTVGADFFCDPTVFRGKASFQLLKVSGEFTCKCEFPSEANFSGSSIGGTFYCQEARFHEKWVLRGARVANLLVDTALGEVPPSRWAPRFGRKASVDLRGLECGQIQAYLLPLLDRQRPYDRQPYTELERTMRRVGQDDLGDAIYYCRRQLEGDAVRFWETPPWKERFWGHFLRFAGDRFLRVVAGYGVRPWRMVIFVMIFPILGWLAFHYLEGVRPARPVPVPTTVQSNMGERGALTCSKLGWADAAWFSVRTYFPVDIVSGQIWEAGDCVLKLPGTKFALLKGTSLASLIKIAGWIFIPTALATFTGLLRHAGSAN